MTMSQLDPAIEKALMMGSDEAIAARKNRRLLAKRITEGVGLLSFAGNLISFVLLRVTSPTGLYADIVATNCLLCAALSLLWALNVHVLFLPDTLGLTPLSQAPEFCSEALTFVERYDYASRLRDAVLASGRQLYVEDYFLMKRLVSSEEKRGEPMRKW